VLRNTLRRIAATIPALGAALQGEEQVFHRHQPIRGLDPIYSQVNIPGAVSRRTPEDVLLAVLSALDVLEIEAARLVVLAKANSEDAVLCTSASLIYETVAALREHLRELSKRDGAAVH
jgi:hypothetical protein